MIQRRAVLALGVAGTSLGVAGCLGEEETADPDVAGESLTLATTTSTYDTGLLEELNAAFETEYGATVKTVAQGTGAALRTGRNGDADTVLVHARSLEDAFLRDGHGVNRRDLMYNDFVVLGPESDPAGIDGAENVSEAFRSIAAAEAVFVSRGDNSGTHQKERALWAAAGGAPEGDWYREAGSGMGEVLTMADESDAYTLADRGTYLARASSLSIGIRVQGPLEGGPDRLANPYGIVAVNPEAHPSVKYALSMTYIGFVTSPTGQELIGSYTIDGHQLFFPDALSEDPNFDQYVPRHWSPERE